MSSPSTPRRVRAGHARRPQQLVISAPSATTPMTAAVAMKRESSIESSVSASRVRVTKRLKTGAQLDAASATVHLYLPYAAEHASSKLVLNDVVASVSQPKRKRNGHFKSESVNEYHGAAASDSSDGGNSSGDEADDEVDTVSRGSRRRTRSVSSASPVTDVEDAGGDMTDIDDDDESETHHVEMSIVEHVAPVTPASSTFSGFPSAQTFPWFASAPATPSSARQVPRESPLHQVEDILSAVRHGNGFLSSSSSDGSAWESGSSRRGKKRSKVVERDEEASGVEDAMLGKSETVQSVMQRPDDTQYTYQHVSPQGQRILIATVSGVTAGLQALAPLHQILKDNGSDAEMRSFASLTDTDGYETDATMQMDSDVHMASIFLDNEPMMTLDQFSAYRSERIKSEGNRPIQHTLVKTSRLRGQNIQEYLSRLGYTLPIPLVRSVARKKRCLRDSRVPSYKRATRLTGNLREDLLVRALAKYRRDAVKVYNRNFAVTVEQAARMLESWGRAHEEHGFGTQPETDTAVVEVVVEPSSNQCRALVPYRPRSPVGGNPFVRTHSERIESYEPLYPEAAERYTRALLSMLRDRFPAWDRWWSDERRYASHRASWADYDAETVRLECEARQIQDSLTRRRRVCGRSERLDRLGFGGAAIAQGMPTRMDRDEQDLIEQSLLEARIQRFRALVNAPPVRAPLAITISDHTSTAVIPSSPPPAYHSQSASLASATLRLSSQASNAGAGPSAVESSPPAAALIASPPRLPAYQPDTYRRGISPPPPPPFNARTDAIPVRDMSQAVVSGRRLTFERHGDSAALPGSFATAHIVEHFEAPLEAPIAIRPRSYDTLLSERVPTIPAPAQHSSDAFDDEDDEVEDGLDDLLDEVEEEDVQEQARAEEAPAGRRLGCAVM